MLEQEYRSLQRLMEIAELRQKGIQDTHLLDWNFRVAEDTPYVQMGKRYVNNWKQVKAENLGLLFWGDVGTGKSFLAACIANGLLDQGVSVRMTNFTWILNKLSDLQVKEKDHKEIHYPRTSHVLCDAGPGASHHRHGFGGMLHRRSLLRHCPLRETLSSAGDIHSSGWSSYGNSHPG